MSSKPAPRSIQAVFFDLGETLVDETRMWGDWADWLGVPRLTLFGVLGGVIERGEHHQRAFEILQPGLDVEKEFSALLAARPDHLVSRRDLYPDALSCLLALRQAGYRLGVAGNYSLATEAAVRRLDLPVDVILSSATLGAAKPSPHFFSALETAVGVPAPAVAYVGDRLDNDILPAAAAGMLAVLIRRGPWGHLQAERPEARRADIRIDSLADLPALLERVRTRK